MGRGQPKASFRWWGFVVHHLRVWPSRHHLWGHGWHAVGRGTWPVEWRETLHVWWWGNRRTLEWDKTGPCAKQTTRRWLEVSWRTTRERTWRSTWRHTYLVT